MTTEAAAVSAAANRRLRRRDRTPSLARRIAKHYAAHGSLDVAAQRHRVTRKFITTWMDDTPWFAELMGVAFAKYMEPVLKGLRTERDAVLAGNYRYIAARRLPEFRLEKSGLEKAIGKHVSRVIFETATPPAKKGATP